MILCYYIIEEYFTVKCNIMFIMDNFISITKCAKLKILTEKLNFKLNLQCNVT